MKHNGLVKTVGEPYPLASCSCGWNEMHLEWSDARDAIRLHLKENA